MYIEFEPNRFMKYKLYFSLNFLNGCHFETKWRIKLISELGWCFGAHRDSTKSSLKYGFYLNINDLNGWHFERKWWMKLMNELGWGFGICCIHTNKFQPNRLINTDFIQIFINDCQFERNWRMKFYNELGWGFWNKIVDEWSKNWVEALVCAIYVPNINQTTS